MIISYDIFERVELRSSIVARVELFERGGFVSEFLLVGCEYSNGDTCILTTERQVPREFIKV